MATGGGGGGGGGGVGNVTCWLDRKGSIVNGNVDTLADACYIFLYTTSLLQTHHMVHLGASILRVENVYVMYMYVRGIGEQPWVVNSMYHLLGGLGRRYS